MQVEGNDAGVSDCHVDEAGRSSLGWHRRRMSRGVALIATLMLLTAIAGLTSVMSLNRLSDADFFNAYETERRDYFALESALNIGVFHLLDHARSESREFMNSGRMTAVHEGRSIELTLEFVSGKVDLNAGDPLLIRRSIASVFPTGAADVILMRWEAARMERRLIWRVEDILPPLERYGPLNILAQSRFTIYSGVRGVALSVAASDILRAIPGMMSDDAERILDARRTGVWPTDLGRGIDRELLAVVRPIYRVVARFQGETERKVERHVTIEIDPKTRAWKRLAGGA